MLEALKLILSKFADATPQLQPVTLENGTVFTAHHLEQNIKVVDAPKGSVVRHLFSDLGSFALYLNRAKRLGLDADQVDILVAENTGVAQFGPQAAQFDAVKFSIPKTILWAKWGNGLSRLSQGDLLAFLRAYGSVICDAINGEGKVVAAGDEHLMGLLRALQVSKETNFKTELTRNGNVKLASADQSTDLSVTLPESFEIELPIYEGVDAPIYNTDGKISGWTDEPAVYRLKVLLSVDTSHGLSFSLSLPTASQAVVKANGELCAYLGHLLDDSFLVCQGKAETKHAPVYDIDRPIGPVQALSLIHI